LERSGVAVDRASQSITATLATPDIAEVLDVQIGSALLAMTRVVFDPAGRGVEYLQALYRPDLHTFHMDLQRTGAGSARQWAPQASEPETRRRAARGGRRS
ncbi:MAG: UTRA domain-containing protein, partial [Beijerinckiaceae bacterium]